MQVPYRDAACPRSRVPTRYDVQLASGTYPHAQAHREDPKQAALHEPESRVHKSGRSISRLEQYLKLLQNFRDIFFPADEVLVQVHRSGCLERLLNILLTIFLDSTD